MNDIHIVMFCTVVLAIVACVIHNSTKTIADSLHRKIFGIEEQVSKGKSPYGLTREQGKNKSWGYCITKNDKIVYSMNGSAVVYSQLSGAVKDMNVLEELEGYEKTVIKG